MEVLHRVNSVSDALTEVRGGVSRIEKACAACPARFQSSGKLWTAENLRLALLLGLVIMASTLGADGVRALLGLLTGKHG